MKRTLILLAALTAFGCADFRKTTAADYETPFYAKYLNTGSSLDARINRALAGLRSDPTSAALHNELGMLLVQKGFPNDAEREFERAINLDGKYHEAWYNLGLVRAARGDEGGARRAWMATIHNKPGHAQALFQLGLVEEKLQHTDRAVDLYAKAIAINPRLMDVAVNPRVLDTKLLHLALIQAYPAAHDRASMQFQGGGARRTTPQQAPSAQPTPQQIIPPAAPATDPSQQPAPVRPPV
ncbi:MAG TPA: tetratricopeptide repeat protein [Thermoanaerobaculia bacterium]|jgi:tetratricopeptide (TPR) repeat protein|nr:tetratricopeptide repeat protein [Thermoanaerobaculia bacterium]